MLQEFSKLEKGGNMDTSVQVEVSSKSVGNRNAARRKILQNAVNLRVGVVLLSKISVNNECDCIQYN